MGKHLAQEIPEPMPPAAVVEDFDTLGDLSLSLLTCHIASLLDQSVLQCSLEPLSIGALS